MIRKRIARAAESGIAYFYPRFEPRHLLSGLAFTRGPSPGEAIPGFDLESVDGTRLRQGDFAGRPLLVTFASLTCPLTASATPVLKDLHREFRERMGFLTVYVREAYPGEHFPQPRTMDEKRRHATAYREREDIPWPVAIDDLDGTVHQAFDAKPCSAYLVDGSGRVMFRTLWAGDARGLRRAIHAVLGGAPIPIGQREPVLAALLAGTGSMDRVLRVAGPDAQRAMRRSVAPLYALAWLAAQFRPLSPRARAVAALALASTGLAAAGSAARALARRARPEALAR